MHLLHLPALGPTIVYCLFFWGGVLCVCVCYYTRRHVISHVAAMFGAVNAYAVTTTNMLSDAEAPNLMNSEDSVHGPRSSTAVPQCYALLATHLIQAKYVPPTGAAATSFDSCSNISWWARHQLFFSARAAVSFVASRLLTMA